MAFHGPYTSAASERRQQHNSTMWAGTVEVVDPTDPGLGDLALERQVARENPAKACSKYSYAVMVYDNGILQDTGYSTAAKAGHATENMKNNGGNSDDDDNGDNDDSDGSLPSLTEVFAKDRKRKALAKARAEANLTHAHTQQLVDNRDHEGPLDGAGAGASERQLAGGKLIETRGKSDHTAMLPLTISN
jgi:hypothetical protein